MRQERLDNQMFNPLKPRRCIGNRTTNDMIA